VAARKGMSSTGLLKRLQYPDGATVAAAPRDAEPWLYLVDVVEVDISWWPTRVKTGIHVKDARPSVLAHAKYVAWLAGTNTVYHYLTKLPA